MLKNPNKLSGVFENYMNNLLPFYSKMFDYAPLLLFFFCSYFRPIIFSGYIFKYLILYTESSEFVISI